MVTRDEYLEKTKGYKRPAINFNKRDDFREFAGSGMGQNYHKMMDLQRQAPTFQKNDPRIDDLKQRRRQFNRYDKYNAGSIFGKTPQEMQKDYRFESNELRNRAKPVYNQMYPLSNLAMDVGDKGGIWGSLIHAAVNRGKKKAKVPIDTVSDAISETGKGFWGDLKEMGSDIFEGIGIGGAVPRDEATEEVLTNYAEKTFPGEITDESVEKIVVDPRPHEGIPYLTDEAAAIQREFNTNPYFRDLAGENVVLPFEKDRRGHPHLETYTPDKGPSLGTASPHDFSEGIKVPPWLTDPSLPMPEELTEGEYIPGQYYDEVIEEEAPPPIIPFDDTGRESGIRGLHRYIKPNKYEDEFRAYIESGGEFMPYHQFERMYEKIYQGKPHALHSSYR